MVLYFSTGYRVLGIVYLDQLKGACHTHISNHVILTAYLVEYTYNIMYNSNFVLNRKKMMRPQFVDGLTTPKK